MEPGILTHKTAFHMLNSIKRKFLSIKINRHSVLQFQVHNPLLDSFRSPYQIEATTVNGPVPPPYLLLDGHLKPLMDPPPEGRVLLYVILRDLAQGLEVLSHMVVAVALKPQGEGLLYNYPVMIVFIPHDENGNDLCGRPHRQANGSAGYRHLEPEKVDRDARLYQGVLVDLNEQHPLILQPGYGFADTGVTRHVEDRLDTHASHNVGENGIEEAIVHFAVDDRYRVPLHAQLHAKERKIPEMGAEKDDPRLLGHEGVEMFPADEGDQLPLDRRRVGVIPD